MRHVAARVADHFRDQHVRRHVAFGAFVLAQHAADVRVLESALKEAARLHHLVAGVVDGGGRVIDGAYQRVLVGVFGHARKHFANLDAAHVRRDGLIGTSDLRRRIRLHVPGVELAGSADQEQHDAVHVLAWIDGAEGFQAHQIAHA